MSSRSKNKLIPLPNWLDSIQAPGLQQWSDDDLSRLLADLKAGNTPQGAAA